MARHGRGRAARGRSSTFVPTLLALGVSMIASANPASAFSPSLLSVSARGGAAGPRRRLGFLGSLCACSGGEEKSLAERYLEECNKMRPVNPELGSLVLTKKGSAVVVPGEKGGMPPVSSRTVEFVGETPEEILSTVDGADDELCRVHFCDQEHASWLDQTIRDKVLPDKRFSIKVMRWLESPLAKALFNISPWPIARTLVGALGRIDSVLSQEMYPETMPLSRNPLMKSCVTRVMTREECQLMVSDADDYASVNGWTSNRHLSHATVDIPVETLPVAGKLWNETIKTRVSKALAVNFGFEPEDIIPIDVFVVKYSAGEQKELSVHRDGALMTFSLLLNDAGDFEGGGTFFEEDGRVYRPQQGVAVLHSGKRRHGGYPISSGVRYILVGFCLCRSRLLCDELLCEERGGWRFGAPSWYISSKATRDQEILNRVYRRSDAGGVENVQGGMAGVGSATVKQQGVGATSSVEKGASRAESIMSASENPKYRAEAMKTAEEAGGEAVVESLIHGGAHLGVYVSKSSGDVSALLSDAQDRSNVFGHIVIRKAGDSDDALEKTIEKAFGVKRDANRYRMAALVSVVVDRERRGKDLGSAMMKLVMQHLKELGYDYVLLQQRDTGSGRLISWYSSLGFVDASDFIDVGMIASLNRLPAAPEAPLLR